MSVAFLPFLYQTRTLQRTGQAPIVRQFLRSLHASAPKYATDPIPFELPPEYQNELQSSRPNSNDPRGTITPSERATFDRIFEEIAARRPPQASASTTRSATTNPKLLKEQTRDERSSRLQKREVWRREDLPKPGLTPARRQSINVLISDAAQAASGHPNVIRGLDKFSPLETTVSAADRQKALMRFPPSLRRAANLALGVLEPVYDGQEDPVSLVSEPKYEEYADETQNYAADGVEGAQEREERDVLADGGVSLDPLARQLQVETQRRNLRRGIEMRMKNSKSDFELWDVMEQEVFPLVDRLGIGERSKSKPRRESAKKAAKIQTGVLEAELSMDVYGPCYPSLLLFGLRLLDDNFVTTSPLALSILPRVKELGLASYVLGVSTPFYNTLMSIHWYRYGDVSAVLSLLEEMQHAGLYCEQNSVAIVHSMEHYLVPYSLGKYGRFLEEMMAMPDLEDAVKTRLRHWKRQIERDLNRRPSELGY